MQKNDLTPALFQELGKQGKSLILNYTSGEYRTIEAGDCRAAGDYLIIQVAGQRPVRVALNGIEKVTPFDTYEAARAAARAAKIARRSAV